MKKRPVQEVLTLVAIFLLSLLFIKGGGYHKWFTGYVLLYLIQGYVAWFIFSKCGQPFYGYAVTMAIGAFSSIVSAEVYGWPLWGGILLGGLLSSVIASTLFVATSRARGFYVGMVSFLLVILFPSLIEALRDITGGRSGMSFRGLTGLIGLDGLLWLVLGFVIVAAATLFWLMRTRIGRILALISENDDLAKAVGINTFKYKLLAYAIGGCISGLGGGLYVNYIGSISSVDLGVITTIYITFIPIVGGSKVPFGPVIGTLFIRLIPEALADIERYLSIIFGAAFVFVMLGMRGGIGDNMVNYVGRVTNWIRLRRAPETKEG
jgi:branched-chain amino acid transport system permease protein